MAKTCVKWKKFLQVFNHIQTETCDYLQWSGVPQWGKNNVEGEVALPTKPQDKVKRVNPN